jgi:hypothetical protein
MADAKDTILIQVNVEITTEALQTVVTNTKKLAGRNEKGFYRVDTADAVSNMISRFLLENDFEGFTKNLDNYH